MARQRSVFEVIDQAIKENRVGEDLAYFICLVSIAGSVTAFYQAMTTNNVLWAGAGAIPSLFLWPALNATVKIRKQNKAIRLMEIPLSRATTAKEAAQTIREFFSSAFEVK